MVKTVIGMAMSKSTSCGVLVTNGKVLLLGHSTGNKHWDIPKGSMDEGETVLQTALRELKEETNISLSPTDVVDLGLYSDYTPRKKLHLFLYKTNNLPELSTISCKSMCQRGNEWIPELDAFKYIKFYKINQYVTKNMNRTLETALNRI